jgi:hypothetical protein
MSTASHRQESRPGTKREISAPCRGRYLERAGFAFGRRLFANDMPNAVGAVASYVALLLIAGIEVERPCRHRSIAAAHLSALRWPSPLPSFHRSWQDMVAIACCRGRSMQGCRLLKRSCKSRLVSRSWKILAVAPRWQEFADRENASLSAIITYWTNAARAMRASEPIGGP